jgi:hypothetical protein
MRLVGSSQSTCPGVVRSLLEPKRIVASQKLRALPVRSILERASSASDRSRSCNFTSRVSGTKSSAGFFLFVPGDYDKDVIGQSGLQLLASRDVTSNMAEVAEKRRPSPDRR